MEKAYLTGKFIISPPGVEDELFSKAVILICSHDESGAMGVIINKAIEERKLDEIISKLNISFDSYSHGLRVMMGGPLDGERGFLLHSPEYHNQFTGEVKNLAGFTTSSSVLKDISSGHGPHKSLLALGYAGWSQGQLEQEIKAGVWLVCDGDDKILFDVDADKKWDAAIAKIKIDSMRFVDSGGVA
jgi:putative transcriptional regulator